MTDRPRERALVPLLAVALALRVPWLGAVPNPCGDEGNWPLLGLSLSRGVAASLPPDAGFVSTAFAWLIAGSFTLLGPTFLAARLVLVAGLLAAVTLAATRLRRAPALALAAVLLLHPWSVAWSRTASVPYALSLGFAALGPLLWYSAVQARSLAAMVVAAQCLGLAFHFSPLAALPTLACALWTLLPGQREVLRARSSWAAVAAGAVHLLPLVRGIAAVPRGTAATSAPGRLVDAARMMVADLSGAATLRHFAGATVRVELLAAAALLVVAALGARAAWRDPLGRFAALSLAVALVGLPLMLAPARAWSMPTVDADRYGFVLLAPWALGCAAWARSQPVRAVLLPGALALAMTAALAAHFAYGGGPDLGLRVADGGGRYRGWQVARERIALPVLVRAAVVADAEGARAVVTWGDYAFHPIRFVDAAAGDDRVRHAWAGAALPEGRRVYRVTPGAEAVAGWRVVRRWSMADGTPLATLWAEL
jgi:hypothetical protein